jgi:hypothetical protein
MNFLFDQSADFRLIPHLRDLGHNVAAISRNYPPGLADEDILTIARTEHRILVVADRDFGELIFQQGSPTPALSSFGSQAPRSTPRSTTSTPSSRNTLRHLNAASSWW